MWKSVKGKSVVFSLTVGWSKERIGMSYYGEKEKYRENKENCNITPFI